MSTVRNIIFSTTKNLTYLNTTFINCTFKSSFQFINIINISFEGCTFDFPTFDNCILDRVKFSRCIFESSISITNCKVRNSSLIKINFNISDFTRSSFDNCNFDFSDLSNTILTDVYTRNIQGAPLLPTEWKLISNSFLGPQANLENLYLKNVSLDNLNLYGCNLSGAKLENVSMNKTNLVNCVLKNIISFSIKGNPILPIGCYIQNERIIYKQDNILFQSSTEQEIKIKTTNLSPIQIIELSNQNIFFSEILDNYIFCLPKNKYTSNQFSQNKVFIYSKINYTKVKEISLGFNDHIYSFGCMKKGNNYIIVGYKQNQTTDPVSLFYIFLDNNLNVFSIFENNGFKYILDNGMIALDETNCILDKNEIWNKTITSNKLKITKFKFYLLNDCSGINFSGIDLSYYDFSNYSFYNCNFTSTNLSNTNFSNANLIKCNFTLTNFTESILTNVNLEDSFFFQPNFNGAKITSSNDKFILPRGYKIINGKIIGPNMNLDNLDFSGVNFSNLNLTRSTLRNSILTNTKVNGTNFYQTIFDFAITGGILGNPINLESYKIVKGVLVGPFTNIYNQDLSGQNLSNLDLTGTITNPQTNLYLCDFSNSITKNITGMPILQPKNKIINHNLLAAGAVLDNIDLSGGNLNGLELSGTDLTNCNFYNVSSGNIYGNPILSSEYRLINGYIIGPNVNLSDVDLSGQIISNLSLLNTNLDGTDLRNCSLLNISSGKIKGTPLLPLYWKLINGYLVGPSANLENVDFTDQNLYQTNLENTNLRGCIFKNTKSGSIVGTPILSPEYRILNGYIVGKQVDLSGANLEFQNLSNLSLFQTNLTNSKLNYADINGCNIFETNFDNCSCLWIKTGGLLGTPENLPDDIQIFKCFQNQIESYFFVGPNLNLSNIEFKNLDLTNINLSNSNLSNCLFENSNLEQTNLSNCNLLGLRSKNVLGNPLNLNSNWKIKNGFMIGPFANLMFSDFTDLDLSGTYLSSTILNKINFNRTKPGPFFGFPLLDSDYGVFTIQNNNYIIGRGMDLTDMDLSGVDLTLINLSKTNLSNTNLKGAILNRISSSEITGIPSLPEEWDLIGGILFGPTVNLSYSNLERYTLENLNLSYANFKGVNLKNSILRNVNLDYVTSGDIVGEPIELDKKYKIVKGYIIGPRQSLIQIDLSGINLSDMDLTSVDFTNSNLTNVDFTGSILTNTKFLGANLTNITPSSILDTIDLTGAILPLNNYSQYSTFISDQTKPEEIKPIYYSELKRIVFEKLIKDNNIHPDIYLSYIRRINYPIFNKLFTFYQQINGSNKEELILDLNIYEISLRYQIHQKILDIFQETEILDEFLCRLLLRLDIESTPYSLFKIMNMEKVLNVTLTKLFLKNLFQSKFHTYLLKNIELVLFKIKKYLRLNSTLYQNNQFIQNQYGVNNTNQKDYWYLREKFPKQLELLEMYLFSEDILNEYTNSSIINGMFKTIIQYNRNGLTPVVMELFKRIVKKIFGSNGVDNSILVKLMPNTLMIDFDFELYLLKILIEKNKLIVDQIFQNENNLKLYWDMIKSNSPSVSILENLDYYADTLDEAILNFRILLITKINKLTFSVNYHTDLTQTILETREGYLESLANISDDNLSVIQPYLEENEYIKRILQEPQIFLEDLYQNDFSKVKDVTKFYGFSYFNDENKKKLIKLDIHQKLKSNELKYIKLFTGSKPILEGNENLIAPLEVYQKVFNEIIS